MIDGLWIVQFHGPQGVGGGVVVLVGNQVLGGDSAFSYDGTFEFKDDIFKAKVFVKNFDAAVPNVLGIPSPFELLIEGKLEKDGINGIAALATLPDSKMVVRLKKSVDLK
jgi:hypothetical protein